ncbi:hypothetical protein SCE1572_04715 [Sorangium cellulosum So0157-2]|uniref:Uncharacterized protein n=1 Tax=Sorangium cellulosum So0157-2 TaxID=1254432 RepID=S4XMQ1_SORCE|nr:hypothetical protein SCE1572_04715 [Sorangium cellulosum So0157-2]
MIGGSGVAPARSEGRSAVLRSPRAAGQENAVCEPP